MMKEIGEEGGRGETRAGKETLTREEGDRSNSLLLAPQKEREKERLIIFWEIV